MAGAARVHGPADPPLGGRPFGPWTAVADLPEGRRPPKRGALAGTAFDLFAQVYEQCLEVSPALTPPVVDDMELWEVAVVLGKARGERADEQPAAEDRTSAVMRRYQAKMRRRQGLPELPDEPDRPQRVDPALVTLIPTNAPERLR